MHIGLPKEIKDDEFRVVLTPEAAGALVRAGHAVTLQPGAGAGAGFADAEYAAAGAQPGDPWAATLIVKVKELQPSEYGRARAGQTYFGFHHFGPDHAQLDAALRSGATYAAFETVGELDRSLPILAPMSAIAGRLAVQAGAWFLQKPNGGSGILLPGVADVPGARVLIVGAGNVGSNALAVASGMGAQVRVFDRSPRRFAELQARHPRARFDSDPSLLAGAVAEADLAIGAVLVPGGLAPKVFTRAMLARMRPGSVLVDVAIDQGGCAETSRPTRHSAPTYVEEGVVHYCVPNMPSACARTASLALSRAALPWVLELAAGKVSPALRTAFQVRRGKVLHAQLARDTGLPCETP
ncbi:MAG TPA: alanine dehydrogenase [Burkholderiales bacterium]|nr:alanine dehydrogenase [Burkholderiales bacterium]